MAVASTAPDTMNARAFPPPMLEVWDADQAGVSTSGCDADGEAILVEEEPQPHEVATDPALRCRYPSKHCLRQRTLKKTGSLHSMCAFHRAKANRNQRRLEKRKRMLKDAERQRRLQRPRPLVVDAAKCSVAVHASPRDVNHLELEPFRAPVPLFQEDLDELQALVDVGVFRFDGALGDP